MGNSSSDTIPQAISAITTKAYDKKTKITKFKWTIKSTDLEHFKSLGGSWNTPTFESSHNLKWYIKCYPNCHERCDIYLYLSSLPKQYKHIEVYWYIYCEQTHSSYQYIDKWKKAGSRLVDSKQLSSELLPLKDISFECGIKILRTTGNNDCYQYPLNISDIFKTQHIDWKINKNVMNKIKAANDKKAFIPQTPPKNNEMFSMTMYPNGSHKQYKGNMDLLLNLCCLPIGVNNIKLKYKMQCKEMNKIHTETVDCMGYERCHSMIHLGETKKLLSYPSLNIMADIEILECKDDKNKVITGIQFKDVSNSPNNDDDRDDGDNNNNNSLQTFNIKGGHGLALIVAIKDYKTLTGGKCTDLDGTKIDRKTLKKLFENEYKYNTVCIDGDIVTYDDFHELITEIRGELNTNYDKYDVFVFAFSGHGDQDSIYFSDGKCFDRVGIYKFFNGLNCKRFKDKPKMFMIDACKGGQVAPSQKARSKSNSLNIGNNATHPDDNIIIFNANSDDYVSYDTANGGILIQSVHDVLTNNKSKISLDDMTKLIDIKMKEYGGDNKMQTLQNIQQGIKKKIYFCKPLDKENNNRKKGILRNANDKIDDSQPIGAKRSIQSTHYPSKRRRY